MKPILVPVDFSGPAENAARYAVYISRLMKSNIYLCHAFLTPAGTPIGDQVIWPLYEDSELEQINKDQLRDLAKRLEIKDYAMPILSSFHPKIFCAAVAGNTKDVFIQLINEKRIGLVIMGMSGAGAVARFFMGSVSRETIEHVDCPVLLIPSGVKFSAIRKIAFATDLSSSDVEVIHSLAALAKHFEADLVVTHITDEHHDNPQHHKTSEAFLRDVTNQINYDRIYYRHVNNKDVDEGLDWLTENGRIDMLAMVHHKKGLFSRIFGRSHSKRQAGHISLPLLVFPSGRQFTF